MYADKTRKSLNHIGLKIIEHCLSYFLTENCPKVILKDDEDILNLNDLFTEDINVNTKTDKYYVGDEEFKITHVKMYDTKKQDHRIHFCANNREVQTKKLDKIIPDATGFFKDGEKSFKYSAYISADLLDKNVSDDRTSFKMNEKRILGEKISMKEIEEKTIDIINEYLKDYVEPIKIKKDQRIRNYICKEKPQYRIILKYKEDALNKISPNIKDEDLEIELFKIKQEIDRDLKEKSEIFLKNNKPKDIKDLEEYKKSYQRYIEMENDRGKSSLAEYIAHRKVVLDLLENAINLSEETGKYPLEEYIHNLIFPMKTTSDEVSYDKHNLWIIDEKLSYHYYLASDKPMKNIDVVSSDSISRQDSLIMDRTILISDETNKPYNSLTIIEFKRAMRNDYSDNSNPIEQVYDYVREIRAGLKKDRNERPLMVNENTSFYLYIIADITEQLKKNASSYRLNRTVDGMGYFGYNDSRDINAYVEIISYDKLLSDAQKKNRILFDKLFGK